MKHIGAFTSPQIDEITARRKQLEESQEWIVDRIFPSGAMHLIGGPSGVGKTTWLFQMLYEWEQGLQLFGEYKSNPCPWVYISADRSIREMQQTLARIGYGDWQFEAYALEELIYIPSRKCCEPPDFTKHVLDKFPYAKLIVMEGLQAIMPDHSKNRSQNKQELLWALEQRLVLSSNNRTVIATTHNPKVGANTMQTDERSKFLGSQGFIGSCSTMIGIEKGKSPESRLVTVMGRNFQDMHLTYSCSNDTNGRFVLESIGHEAIVNETDEKIKFSTWCQTQHVAFSAKDAIACGMRMGISDSTVERWLLELAGVGALEKVREGKKYLYPRPGLVVN